MPSAAALGALARACHPGPTVAVTLLATLLAVGAGAGPGMVASVGAAVLTGQLVIGWSNDLVDLDRDLASGRADKPLVGGELSPGALRTWLLLAASATVVLSLLLGWLAGAVHLLLVVGSGVAYNLGLKATAVSWLPYAVAFGSLPQVAWLAGMESFAPWWASTAGAMLGVGAHLLNALPDLVEDERHGVRGWPHRLGAARVRRLAPALLLAGVALAVLGPAGRVGVVGVLALLLAGVLAVLAWTSRGRAPFWASMLMAVVAAVTLVLA